MVDLQSSNRVKISKVRETTFAVTPANPAFKALRQVSSGLALNPQTVISNEIRSDRQVADAILVGYQAGGDIAGEMSFNTMDDHLEEAMQGTWTANPSITVVTLDTEISDVSTTTITVSAGGTNFKTGHLILTTGFNSAANNNIINRVVSNSATTIVCGAASFTSEANPIQVGATVRVVGFMGASGDLVLDVTGGNHMTSTTLDFTTLGLVAGMWLKIGGAAAGNQFATAVDNDWVRLLSFTAHQLVLDRVPTGFAADAGTAKTVQVFMGDFLINGSTKRSNTIERQYLDHSPVTYEYLTGQTIDRFSVSVRAAAIATYTVTYVGATASVTTTRVTGATDTTAPTNDVLNAASNVGRIGFNGAVMAAPDYIMEASWQYSNNLRRQLGVGSLGAIGIGNGEFNVSGKLTFYFGDKSVLDFITNNTLISYDIRVGRTDTNNESLVFDFPSIKLTAGSPSVSGKNTDVMLDASFQAIKDTTYGYTASISRFFYLP